MVKKDIIWEFLNALAEEKGSSVVKDNNEKEYSNPSKKAITISKLGIDTIRVKLSELEKEIATRKKQNAISKHDLMKLFEKNKRNDLTKELFIGSSFNKNKIVIHDNYLIELEKDVSFLKDVLKRKECESIKDDLFTHIPHLMKNTEKIEAIPGDDSKLKIHITLSKELQD